MADAPSYEKFEFLGMKVPLTQRAVSMLGLVVIVGVSLFVWTKFFRDPEKAILTLKQVNEQLAESVEEYGRHVIEEPEHKHEFFTDADGGMAIRVFNDHCVLIVRRSRDGVRTKLITDIAKIKKPTTSQLSGPPPLLAGFGGGAITQPGCQRGCLEPHPGNFRWWYGARRGDWVEVWRQWPEGCTHFQMFHPPSNSWATRQNGTPDVRWQCCVH